ncbi:MAG: hypothetical protein IJ231_06115 [Clostridia bacterium]|nr:hypothetical protein [Clostridia bacterium]
MLPETGVSFHTEDAVLQGVWDAAEAKCRLNLRDFGGDRVLVEGGGYQKIWLETQPMGGEMYALRDLTAAKNNCGLFLRHQRADGRLPGSIQCVDGRVEPQFNKYQGFCFPWHALNLYYLLGEDGDWLDALAEGLRRFDGCLWRTRNLGEKGLLSSFCVYDTGEDLALRYGDAPCWWTEDTPPEGFAVVPMASMDVTSWSYACRDTLAAISRLRGDEGQAACWARKAAEVAESLRKGLWDEARGACYDRDKNGKTVEILCHNTLRCMYWGSLSPAMADRFVRDHLLNPREFWTPMPLPSVAADDPAFRNAPENNWSGQPEGLTFQRAILALENYGYFPLVTALGDRLLRAIAEGGNRFTQQFDPFTGAPSLVHARTHQPLAPDSREPAQDAYGPTMLAALEYTAHRYGIHPHLGRVWFSLGKGPACEYDAAFYGHRYAIRASGDRAEISVDGRPPKVFPRGQRVVTDAEGRVLDTVRIDPEPGEFPDAGSLPPGKAATRKPRHSPGRQQGTD